MAMAASGVARSAPVAPTAPSCPLSSFSTSSSSSSSYRTLSDHPTHPLRMGLIPFSVRRDCTARGRYWGAYRSARGGAPLTLHRLALSLYLSVSLPRFPSTYPFLPLLSLRRIYRSIVRTCTSCLFLPFPFHHGGVLYLFISRAFSLSLLSSVSHSLPDPSFQLYTVR